MNSLAALQSSFLAHLRAPADATFDNVRDGCVPAATGLRIYAHAYRSRLVEALETDHPMLGLYLGDGLWSALCDGYIDAYPSRVRSLRDFGARLSAYLAETAPFNDQPAISELAQFERLLLDTFDAEDADPLAFGALSSIPPTQWLDVRLGLHPALRVFRPRTNAVQIWTALRDGAAPPPAAEGSMPAWISWRDADRMGRYRSLQTYERAALDELIAGRPIASACVAMTSYLDEASVAGLFVEWIQGVFGAGWVMRVEQSGER
ncbi:HvfC/BufC family peptide modification chaperone [Lysobacter xanthus]